jgi:hypothetical protein
MRKQSISTTFPGNTAIQESESLSVTEMKSTEQHHQFLFDNSCDSKIRKSPITAFTKSEMEMQVTEHGNNFNHKGWQIPVTLLAQLISISN